MRDSKELLELLRDAERLVPVEKLTASEIPVWPILRVYTAFRLRDDYPRQVSRSIVPYALRKKVGAFKAKRPSNPLPSGKVDFLTIGQASHRTDEIGGKAFNRFTDPIHTFLAPQKGLHFEIDFDDNRVEYPYPTFNLAPWLDWTRRKHSSYLSSFSSELNAWCDAMRDRYQDDYFHSEHVAYWIDLCFAAERLADEMWKDLSPKALLLASFYDPVMFGFIRSAHKAKVPVIELQHGVQGEGHFGYTGWKDIPSSCYTYLPSNFVHFSRVEAESLQARMPVGKTTHWVMGNSWMRYSKHELGYGSKTKSNKALVTLGISEKLFDDVMLHIMKVNEDMKWLVRMHPRSLDRMEEVKNILKENGIRSFEVEESTRMPLYEVLSQAKFHMTRQSTVALEALDFGIKTILTSVEGQRYYSEQIDKDWMRYCSQPGDWDSISPWLSEQSDDMSYSEQPEMPWTDLLTQVKG